MTRGLTRWTPASDLWSNRMRRVFDETFNDFLAPLARSEEVSERAWLPAVDVRENNEALELFAELPGLKREDVSITLENNVLSISGERKFEQEDKDGNYHRIERTYGRFNRSFTVPSNVEAEAVKADFDEGVLHVTLPKSEQARPRQIQID